MRKRQENKFTMYNSVNTFLGENERIVSSIQELNESFTAFRDKCDDIQTKSTTKRTASAGKAVAKLRNRSAAITKCLAISASLYSYAVKTEDDALKAITNIDRSDLELIRDTALVEVLDSIYELAQARLAVLEPFGIDTTKLEAYKSITDKYKEAFGSSQSGIIKRKGATQSIPELFGQADDILVKIDKYVKGMQDDDPEFVRHYEDARQIRNLGLRHNKETEPLPPDQHPQPGENPAQPPENNSPPAQTSAL